MSGPIKYACGEAKLLIDDAVSAKTTVVSQHSFEMISVELHHRRIESFPAIAGRIVVEYLLQGNTEDVRDAEGNFERG